MPPVRDNGVTMAGAPVTLGLFQFPLRFAVATGFFGAFTTFSTCMVQSVSLYGRGARAPAALSLLGSLLAGVLAAAARVTRGAALTP